MTTIVTRASKGSPLSWTEADANFTNLNTDKAPIDSPTFTGTVSGVTQTMVGLSNVDNTSDNTKNAATAALTNKTIGATTNIVEARSGPDTTALSFRNCIINGNFSTNQRGYVSGGAVGAGLYGHDRWKMGASGDNYTFNTTANKTTVTIPSTKVLQQVIEGVNLFTGTYVLSWEGTAQGKIGGGSYGSSGVTASVTGGVNLTIEFGAGTVSNIQFERGSIATPFEQRPIGLELSLCQRYYELLSAGQLTGISSGTTEARLAGIFRVVKRGTTTVGFTQTSGTNMSIRRLAANVDASTTTAAIPDVSATFEGLRNIHITGFSGLTSGEVLSLAGNYLYASAEL